MSSHLTVAGGDNFSDLGDFGSSLLPMAGHQSQIINLISGTTTDDLNKSVNWASNLIHECKQDATNNI